MKKQEKRQARETTLKILYEQEFNKEKQAPASLNKITQSYVNQLLKGIANYKREIDKLIRQTSKTWKMNRISLIDLNIIRIAIYEMLYATPPIPFKVCIDESVEIAKIYGAADSSKFINGILDTISKKQKTKT